MKIGNFEKLKKLENSKNKRTWGEGPGRPTPEGPGSPSPPLRGFVLKIRKIRKFENLKIRRISVLGEKVSGRPTPEGPGRPTPPCGGLASKLEKLET